jgi:hypothetical protein
MLAKGFEPLIKRAARLYKGALSTELNKMGEFPNSGKGIGLVIEVPTQMLFVFVVFNLVGRKRQFRTILHGK